MNGEEMEDNISKDNAGRIIMAETSTIRGSEIKVTDDFRERVVDIYLQAFGRKINAILSPEKNARFLLKKAIRYENAIYMIDNSQNPVGFVGYQTQDSEFSHYRFEHFRPLYNPLSAFLKYFVFKVFSLKVKNNEIRIDSVAVRDDLRGLSIGTAMLEYFFDFARTEGFEKTYLEVVDTNPKAKKLYERLGFVRKKTTRFYFLTASAGFSSEDIMYRKL